MKHTFTVSILLLSINVFAQSTAGKEPRRTTGTASAAEKELTPPPQQQEVSHRYERPPFEIGPYRNGEYEYFNRQEKEARESEEEKEETFM